MYNKEVIELFMHPKNVGEIKNADSIGIAGNLVCGDLMKIYLKIKNEKITNIKFKTLGCAAAIATSSKVTELAKGKSIKDALKITKDDIVKSLGGLPLQKIHCSLLAIDALREAIYLYLKKNNKKIPEFLEEEHQRIEKNKKIIEERFHK